VIKLELPTKPVKLTTEKKDKLTLEFINSGKKKVVWKYKYIYDAVTDSSFTKCCFSEIKLNTKSTYVEIEHFYPKDIYPNEVVEWGNLLPSCKKCNTTKGKTDTKITEIINPYVDNPKEHLFFEYFRLFPKNGSLKGKNTIKYTALNNRIHFVEPRSKQTLVFLDRLNNFYVNFIEKDTLISLDSVEKANKIDQLKGFLCDINRKNEFSACISTTIYDSTDFKKIKEYLELNNLWDIELQSFEKEILFCYLGK